MAKKTLVTYATKHGATADIAERIGRVLRKSGIDADVLPVDRVNLSAGYDAVVLGSAVYMGRWRKEAVRFLKAREAELSALPVWIFSSGPSGEGDPVKLLHGWRFPSVLQSVVDRVRPRDVAVFHGSLDLDKVGRFERWVVRRVKATAGDFRDWNAVEAWARGIGDALRKVA